MSGDLSPRAQFPDIVTGEVLPATPENAHHVLRQIAESEQRLRDLKAAITDWARDESERLGTKTFNVTGGSVVLTGGPTAVIEGQELAQLLREAGCPEERIAEVVTEEITYKVNRRVLNQLTGANADYKAAAELVTTEVEKPWRASAK